MRGPIQVMCYSLGAGCLKLVFWLRSETFLHGGLKLVRRETDANRQLGPLNDYPKDFQDLAQYLDNLH